MVRKALFLVFLLVLPGAAEDPPAPVQPSKKVVLTTLQWMQSTDPARRQAAYRSIQLFDKEAMPVFAKALRKALEYHERRLADTLDGRNSKENPYSELIEVARELKEERERVYKMVKTDYKKDKGKIDILRNDFANVERLYKNATRLASTDTASIDKQIDGITDALVEIHEQLARFEGESLEEIDDASSEERKREALEESFDGHSYLQAAQDLGTMRSEVQRLRSTNEFNDACSWASSSQRDFAKLISYERAVLGLGPLRLEEYLSEAATGHSQDMKTMGFFSHTSPVKGKKSFVDRARKAGFKGGPSGECIAAGYANAAAAYRGWFYSDGHRFIMMAKGPNLHGIGRAGNHWTLVTGRK